MDTSLPSVRTKTPCDSGPGVQSWRQELHEEFATEIPTGRRDVFPTREPDERSTQDRKERVRRAVRKSSVLDEEVNSNRW